MRIGVKHKMDDEIVQYYSLFYDTLGTPNWDAKSRLLNPNLGFITIGNPKAKKCRFCGKGENEVTFKKLAHAFPESIGNNILVSHYECDICNQYFGNTIENEYANFFSLYHSVMQISGKSGVPKCGYKVPCSVRTDRCADHCIEISFRDNTPYLIHCKEVDNEYIRHSNNSVTISKPVGRCCPIAVFKAIVKMAVTVMPIEELSLFRNTIKWIRDAEHFNIYENKKLLVRYQMIPGFNVTKYPHYILFRRKRTVWDMPYMLFNLTYGCFSLFIEIPRDFDNDTSAVFTKMPFPPIPFYTSENGIWDLSGHEIPKGMKHSITLQYSSANECSDAVTISNENGKRNLTIAPNN